MDMDANAGRESSRISIIHHFADLEDPRVGPHILHKLMDILVITMCAVIAGCESFLQIAEYGRHKEAWLRNFLELPHGIPSHDTFARVWTVIDPAKFQECFMRWAAALHDATGGKVIAIDGKTLRRSFDRAKGLNPLHLVSAWCCENHISLGQVAVDAKSNEITAIPALLELLTIKGAIVTIDAAGCQRAIATQIRKQEADYVLALKQNQNSLYDDVVAHFKQQEAEGFSRPELSSHEAHEKAHGREEHRTTRVMPVPESLRNRDLWRDLNSLGMVESRRLLAGREESYTRYFISSLEPDAMQLAHAVRSHWSIENSLHWVLDVTFREDDSRIQDRYSVQNLAALRRLAITLLKREPTKQSLVTKRMMTGWDDDYMFQVLMAAGKT
jgi:predicted transposase YbfD/YdcC